jgi:hypothetical protein
MGEIVKRPAPVVCLFVETPVSTFVAVTVAFGIAAPVASLTVPWMPPSPPV